MRLSEEMTNNVAWPIVVAVTSSLAHGWSGTMQREWPETCSMSYVIMRGIQLRSPSSTSHDMYKQAISEGMQDPEVWWIARLH